MFCANFNFQTRPRAKKNLYLFSECGRTTKSGSEYSSTDELSLIADII